jgi:hypothetical protein
VAKVEYWVMRVVCDAVLPGQKMTGTERIDRLAALWGVVRRNFHVVGGEICEPIEVFDDEHQAMERARREHARTGRIHKVTMIADVE